MVLTRSGKNSDTMVVCTDYPIPVSSIAKVRDYASRKVRERRYEKLIVSGLGLVLDTLLTMLWNAWTTVQKLAEAHRARDR
ncbi:hypothetical protein Pmar_PMAR006716 [Perkinsus marinus ATCC 50983]|uniref:Uncharacterized protein n=1 Tax=Perkinsus marinus (strain ATCC 50983 / TXsc) TaxID=423536 RepID=C5K6A4_PERM5|nr:hypothetical protein Pmar_PMAR006716 [Perkinsus marinus ATCC 50983]EER19824.1 hypothetical protein Pmar_PMAR006716 [Perkinsus marinus ATCC 50983]|eukprot:XP_002788028.1 hypothetical protein Pmar_PMAR006716 [Perkinsus marinus ATCC 50983]